MNSESSRSITFEHVFSSTSNGVIATDDKGNIALINKRAKDALGIDSGKKRDTNNHLISSIERLIKICLSTGEPQIGQHVDWNGKKFVVNVTPIKNQGNLLGTVINFQRTHQFEASARKLHSFVQLNKQLETICIRCTDNWPNRS